MSHRSANPYVVGQWVRGDRFYGRRQQLDAIVRGAADRLWLVGTRRAGKTSLLKQLELEAADSGSAWAPVFWDLQGADSADELALTFRDGLLDGQERLAELGVTVESLPADLRSAIHGLRSELAGRGLGLLLLCDEVEELIGLAESEPGCLTELAAALEGKGRLRVVLCSSPRLHALAASDAGATLLSGFDAPRFLDPLTPDESRSLIRQDQLPAEQRPSLDEGTVEEIRRRCGNHPYLMQLLCRRTIELGGVEPACEVVAGDRMVSHFIAVDLGMLEETERGLLTAAAAGGAVVEPKATGTRADDRSRDPLLHLESLGLLRSSTKGLEVGNDFLRHHLLQLAGA